MSHLKKLLSRHFANRALRAFGKRKGQFRTVCSGILDSGLPDVDIPNTSVGEFVFENIGSWENRTAAECGVTGRKYTYKEIFRKSKNLSGNLRKKFKLEKGDVIAILLPNVPEFPIIAIAAAQAGLVATTVNPIYTAEEITRQLLDSNAKAVVTLDILHSLAMSAKIQMQCDLPILTITSQPNQPTPSGAASFAEFVDQDVDCPKVSVEPTDLAFMPYSSGTTGLPKGVQLTHSNIISNMCQLGHSEIAFSQQTTPDHQDIAPAVLPMFHIYGLTVLCLFQIQFGCHIITLPKFTPELYVGILRKRHPHMLYVVPPIAIFLANHPSVKKEDFDSVRAVVNGAAPLGVLDEAKLIKKSDRDLTVLQGYGLTETSPVVLSIRRSHMNNPKATGSVGVPVPNTQVKIVSVDDNSLTPLGPNQAGELLVKGPQVMKGYYDRPAENVFAEGWFRTGDVMYYNEDGFLFITDRLKELIKVKGFQVPPAELEEIIRDYPDVLEAAVIGIPHDTLGEAPRAYVVPQQGAKIDRDALEEYVTKKVAPYKQLRGGISIVSDIPKNASGKILRRELRIRYKLEGK